MAELETKQTKTSVNAFLNDIEDDQQRKDAKAIAKMMKVATGVPPKMWGTSIVGFGSYSYKYASGHEGEWPLTGFSPREQNLSLYIMTGFKGYQPLLKKLGKHKTGKACLYIKRLDDVDREVLQELITKSVEHKAKAGA
jgi:hypothetical protein